MSSGEVEQFQQCHVSSVCDVQCIAWIIYEVLDFPDNEFHDFFLFTGDIYYIFFMHSNPLRSAWEKTATVATATVEVFSIVEKWVTPVT